MKLLLALWAMPILIVIVTTMGGPATKPNTAAAVGRIGGQEGCGTCFCIDSDPDGSVLITAEHVVHDQDVLMVTFDNKTIEPVVEVIASSEEDDLAMIRVPEAHPAATIAKARPAVGAEVSSVGCPDAIFRAMSFGYNAAQPEHVPGELMICDLNTGPGSSGAPVFNHDGLVVGVVSGHIETTSYAVVIDLGRLAEFIGGQHGQDRGKVRPGHQ